MKVGDSGRYGGAIVAKVGTKYVEVLPYRDGRYDAFVYAVGPRGGLYPDYLYTSSRELRTKAMDLQRMAREIDGWLALDDQGRGRHERP